MKNNIQLRNYHCPKCNGREYHTESVSASGGMLSRIFDIQYRTFTAVICDRCTYTELYRIEGSKLANVFDFIGS